MSNNASSKLKNSLFGNQNIPSLIPGFLLALVIMLTALFLTKIVGNLLPWEKNPLSPILVAIILGLIIRNTIPLHKSFRPGITFGLKKLLRFGIILMGIRLSIFAVLKIGALAVGLVLICIASALILTTIIAKKIGIGERLGTLIAAGTSICGVSAIVATGPTIEADEEEIAYAVGTITIFGILATMTYPYLTELILRLPVAAAGFFLGTSVHDTSQVTATALIYDQLWSNKTLSGLTGADIAITTKLVRNTFMVLVIPFLGFWFGKKAAQKKSGQKIQILKYIPFFVFGYIAMGIIRSLGDYAFTDSAVWDSCWHFVKSSATYVIAVAIACIGLNTEIRKLTKLGLKPFICGLIAALSVGVVSFILVTLFGHILTF
jgi:uncharacterized integral membrane protein (TIGR00698 family)